MTLALDFHIAAKKNAALLLSEVKLTCMIPKAKSQKCLGRRKRGEVN